MILQNMIPVWKQGALYKECRRTFFFPLEKEEYEEELLLCISGSQFSIIIIKQAIC